MLLLLKIFLPVYLVLFFGVAMGWRSYQVWKETGVNPYALGRSDSVYDYVGLWFRLLLIAAALLALIFILFPTFYTHLGPIIGLIIPPVQAAGLVVLVAALVWILVAQAHMGASWRIGIAAQQGTLVERGVFSISRNPIFLGMQVMLFGLFLVLPSITSLAILLLGVLLINIQVRLEEEHLRQVYDAAYTSYCQRVKRWL